MDFEEILNMYDEDTPKLLLFEAKKAGMQQIQVNDFSKLNGCLTANPLDIVLESWFNVLSERLSINTVTFSENKALMNAAINDETVREIKSMIGNDSSKLKMFHDLWLKKFSSAFKNILEHNPKITIDQIVMQLGKQFRISTSSAIRAIISITK
jgi:hypothetical protein